VSLWCARDFAAFETWIEWVFWMLQDRHVSCVLFGVLFMSGIGRREPGLRDCRGGTEIVRLVLMAAR
jgi:hypothetical protein